MSGPAPASSSGRVLVELGGAVVLLAGAIALLLIASQRVIEERRRPRGERPYTEHLEASVNELRDELAGRVALNDRLAAMRDLAREHEHEARVREQVAISAAIGGPVDPWAPP